MPQCFFLRILYAEKPLCSGVPEFAAYFRQAFTAADTLIHARSRNGVKPLSSRREGIMPMGILCADSAIGTMGD